MESERQRLKRAQQLDVERLGEKIWWLGKGTFWIGHIPDAMMGVEEMQMNEALAQRWDSDSVAGNRKSLQASMLKLLVAWGYSGTQDLNLAIF